MKNVIMKAFTLGVNFVYLFFRLLPVKKKVTVISRQSNLPTLDLEMLAERLEQEHVQTVVLAKKLEKSLSGAVSYFMHMFVQMYHIATSEVVVLDSYCILACVLKHRKSLKIIQMWHALSAVKKFGYDTIGKQDGSDMDTARIMRMHRNYDYVLCSSKATASYFCSGFNVDRSKIKYLGLPRIDYILKDKPDIRERITERYPCLSPEGGRRNILYVPTFRKGKTVDVESLSGAIDFDRYNLIVKLHPLDKIDSSWVPKDHIVVDSEFNSYDLLEIADVIISDYSSYVVEASLKNIPLYLYVYDIERYMETTGLNMSFVDEKIGRYAFQNPNTLINAIEEEYDFDILKEFRDKYVDVDTEDCTGQLAQFIRSLPAA
ncbi:MAG: CDP-glycerol glycerophosphotransferase family protein [Eubacteriaceae bacterium]|nr:CDP-glycerol glycerophosphotransferase family protein [Eubacteriaceae bacterium]